MRETDEWPCGASTNKRRALSKTSHHSALEHNRQPCKFPEMKSAYELAMERLEKQAPTVKLTEEQRAEIAEVDSITKARIAEKELFLKEQVQKARCAGQWDEVEAVEKQLASELRRIQEDGEAKKERIRTREG